MIVTLVAYLPVVLGVHAAGDWLLDGGSTRGEVDGDLLWIAFTFFMSVRAALMWASGHRPLARHRRHSPTRPDAVSASGSSTPPPGTRHPLSGTGIRSTDAPDAAVERRGVRW